MDETVFKNLKVEYKAIMLKEMDEYLRKHINDEDCFEPWLRCGVPDEADDSMILSCAEDEACFLDCLYEFANCLLADYDS